MSEKINQELTPLQLDETTLDQLPASVELSEQDLEAVSAGKVSVGGGLGGPWSGFGFRPGFGFGAAGFGLRGWRRGGLGGPWSGLGFRPGLGWGAPGFGLRRGIG